MKKTFSSRLLIILTASVTLFSCSKSSTTPDNSSPGITATFDGSEKTFTTSSIASKSNLSPGIWSLTIIATSSSETLSISLWSEKDDFTAGKTYGISALGGTTYNTLTFGPTSGSEEWFSIYPYATVTESFTCTITEVASDHIKGTFSGSVYKNAGPPALKKEVTKGTFYAKFI